MTSLLSLGKNIDSISVDDILTRHARELQEKTFIVYVDPDSEDVRTITYKQLNNYVKKTALYLTDLGITTGDRFATLMQNTPEVLIFELAGAIIGAATVPLDIKRDTVDRKIFKLADTTAKALFIKTEDSSNMHEIQKIRTSFPSLKMKSWKNFDEFIKILPLSIKKIPRTSIDNHYVILYTSGTTALPKGVLLTTKACLLNAMGIIKWQKLTLNDIFNIVLPLHHINSTEFCLSMFLIGGTIVLNTRYSASKFWNIIDTYKATNSSIVPTILHDLLVRKDEFDKHNPDISSLKRICIGSAPVLPEETIRFYDTFHIRVVQGYGQTETALRVAGVPIDIDEKTYKEFTRNNTIGNELANNHLAIMDENNNEKEENEEGEICISGPILADGYLNNPDETARVFKDGWFHSGDLGKWKMTKGVKYFYIIGRIKEIIIKGGVNISPSAIEDALLKAFPEIDEVSVVGYPDERMGEEIAAVVVPKRSDLLRLKGPTLSNIPGLSPYETPKKIFFVDSLPKTSTGKMQRVEVKKMVADLMKKETQNHYYVRIIDPQETSILQKAVEINNKRWLGLSATLREFIARATNGLVLGIFEDKEGLVGSLCCVRLPMIKVNKLTNWNEATANGTLANNDPNGDTFLCIAISVALRSDLVKKQGPTFTQNQEKALRKLAKLHITAYVNSKLDHVLEFHRKPKGGLPGAKVWKILENGRTDDKESMGYNVLMKYPEITKEVKIVRSNSASPSVHLIEHALFYAKEHGIQNVVAFSRPADFQKYLLSKL